MCKGIKQHSSHACSHCFSSPVTALSLIWCIFSHLFLLEISQQNLYKHNQYMVQKEGILMQGAHNLLQVLFSSNLKTADLQALLFLTFQWTLNRYYMIHRLLFFSPAWKLSVWLQVYMPKSWISQCCLDLLLFHGRSEMFLSVRLHVLKESSKSCLVI